MDGNGRKAVDGIAIGTRNLVLVNVDSHRDRVVPHLFLHVNREFALLSATCIAALIDVAGFPEPLIIINTNKHIMM
jgi:hypothetical protein